MNNVRSYVYEKARAARDASYLLAVTGTDIKNRALGSMADALEQNAARILEANKKDLENAVAEKLPSHFIARLRLSPEKIKAMVHSIQSIRVLPDPIGETMEKFQRPNGLFIEKVRVPLGVVAVIYESRPDVTVESTALCIQSGNSLILKGGREAIHSNKALADILTSAAERVGIPKGAIQFIDRTDREVVYELIKLRSQIDVVIPRGGPGLIDLLVKNSHIPIVESGRGNCHIYVDASADPEMAEQIILNAKTQYPSACNAAEKLLVHASIAPAILPLIAASLRAHGVHLVGCPRTVKIIPDIPPASEEDWPAEYLDLKMAIKIVDNIEEAVVHINQYGTRHSDAIVTENPEHAGVFLRTVDSAVVYHNASTRFTDGGQFGFGGELGISTQKIHVRGPIGLRDLTSSKYLVRGDGQLRGGKSPRVAILGAGSMGTILAERLIINRAFEPPDITVTGRRKEKLERIGSLGAVVETDNACAVEKSDVILLCVKPRDMDSLLDEIRGACKDKLVISIAAGLSLAFFKKKLPQARVMRAMPNICAWVTRSLTALCVSPELTRKDRRVAEQIFRALGKYLYVEEEKLAAFTSISGSGPAYMFLLIDALAQIAQEHGYARQEALQIAAETTLGSAKILLEGKGDVGRLVGMVASKGGTTEAGLKLLENLGLRAGFRKVFARAIERAEEMEK